MLSQLWEHLAGRVPAVFAVRCAEISSQSLEETKEGGLLCSTLCTQCFNYVGRAVSAISDPGECLAFPHFHSPSRSSFPAICSALAPSPPPHFLIYIPPPDTLSISHFYIITLCLSLLMICPTTLQGFYRPFFSFHLTFLSNVCLLISPIIYSTLPLQTLCFCSKTRAGQYDDIGIVIQD